MTDLVAPRPIAWISSIDRQGRENLAPFSYFQAACSSPALITVAIAWHSNGRMKDTLSNILNNQEFTINHVSESCLEAMNKTSVGLEPGISEWEAAGIDGSDACTVRPRRVAKSLAGLECRLQQAIPLGRNPKTGGPSSSLIIAQVVHFWVQPSLLKRDDAGKFQSIDPALLASIGRLGGIAYTRTEDRIDLPAPRGD